MENDYDSFQTANHEGNHEVSEQVYCSFTVSVESSLHSIRYIPPSRTTENTTRRCQTPHQLHIAHEKQQQRAASNSLLDAYEDEEVIAAHITGPKTTPFLGELHENNARHPKMTDFITRVTPMDTTATPTMTTNTAASATVVVAVTDAPGGAETKAEATSADTISPTPQHSGSLGNRHMRNENGGEAQGGAWGPTPPSFYQGSLYWHSAALLKPRAQYFSSKCNNLNPNPTAAATTTSNTNNSSKQHNSKLNTAANNLVKSTNAPVTMGGSAQRGSSSWWCGEVGVELSDRSMTQFSTEDATPPHTPASPRDGNEPRRAVLLPPLDPMNRHRMLEILLDRDALAGDQWWSSEPNEALDRAEPVLSDESRGLSTRATSVCSSSVHALPPVRRSNNGAAALPSSTRDERLCYISGIVRLLLVPEALDLEERDVRRWIRSVNSLRRHAGLWADEPVNSFAQRPQQLPRQLLQSSDGISPGNVHELLSQAPGQDATSIHPSATRQRQRRSGRFGGNSEVDEQSIGSLCTFLELSDMPHTQWSVDSEDESQGDGDGGNGNEVGRAFLQVCAQGPKTPSMHGTPTVFSRGGPMDIGGHFVWNTASNAVGLGASSSNIYGSNESAWNRNGQAVYLENGDEHDITNANAYTKNHGSGNDHVNVIDGGGGSSSSNSSNGGGGGGKSRNAPISHGDRLAIRIASLKAHLVLMSSLLPLALFVGISVFASSVAISGLFVVVLVLLLGLIVYRHIAFLYTLCFSTGESGGWLLISSGLIDLSLRFGGRPLFIIANLLLTGTLLCAAVLFLSFGYVLTGGAIAMLSVLWNLSTVDEMPLSTAMESPMGCQIDERYSIILLLPFFLVAVCAAGPSHARSYICWWETGIFRLVSIVQFTILFITTLLMQIHWTAGVSPNKLSLSLPFFHFKQGNESISSLQWLDDDIFNKPFWASNPVVAYIVLRLSLSVSQLSWLFTCGLSAVKAGTYHLFLVPLLWRRPQNSMRTSCASGRGDSDSKQQPMKQKQQQNRQRNAGKEEYERETEQQEAVSHSLSGVFTASGFGGPFSRYFVFFLVIALTALFVAFVGVSLRTPSLTAPLPVRLLWTAVDQTPLRPIPKDRRPVASCALGILQGAHVGTLRFAAVLSFLTGLLFFAWVPYFIVHVSGMMANLRPGAEPAERQALAASAFLRSKQADAWRSAGESLMRRQHGDHDGTADQNAENVHPAPDSHMVSGRMNRNGDNNNNNNSSRSSSSTAAGKSVDKTPKESAKTSSSPISYFMQCLGMGYGSKASAALSSVIFDLSSPFMSHPELYRATTRAGDGVRVADLFKHLRMIAYDGNWVGYHIAEVLLLRVPFLLAVVMGAAVLVAGRRARCYAFWNLHTVPAPPSSYICRDTSTPISDQLYGRLVLFATISGGLFVAPLIFGIPPFLLLCYWYKKRNCLSMNSRLASLISSPQCPSATAPRNEFGDSIAVPFLSDHTADCAPQMPPLQMQNACGGLAGVRFFVAMQSSVEAAVPAVQSIARGCGSGKPLVTRTALLLERHRHATYLAPLPPSQYRRECEKKKRQRDMRVTVSRWVLDSVLRPLLNAVSVVLSLCVLVLAIGGAERAFVALTEQYDDSSKTHQWTF